MDVTGIQQERPHILRLPAEIRSNILEYVFTNSFRSHGLQSSVVGETYLDEQYLASEGLNPLLVCRQWYQDGSLIAFNKAHFLVSNLFCNVPQQISTLHPKQIEAIRSVAFVADKRHFRKLLDWNNRPFGLQNLDLDTLTIVLHRSSAWHYMFDFTSDIVKLLRVLKGVKQLVFVKNAAMVKGSFRTWYNRLIGLIMKTDHQERYDKKPCNPELTWWTWKYDDLAHSFCLEACGPKEILEEEAYMQAMLPLMEELRDSMEREEWNPDPRARMMYY
ncbi:hypothetical protein Slin15195_G055130 [Septoria linicola]|uniref:Uncharacterized protein n=1 Tax=Septoria linicola TaxID=215465 RepID=A0A9Q9APQ8_9PEZI|nr:hypothetical protein Slin14017_G070990 [Septoria linicola]USW52194.1 hypothetical protein Slin15195_G055130 [Septoria linicola]